MKKKHLHKASHIAQSIDEPDEEGEDEGNEKGTFTEEEYLNMKQCEKTILFTVMEEELREM